MRFREPVVVPISDARTFYPADESHQDYYLKHPAQYATIAGAVVATHDCRRSGARSSIPNAQDPIPNYSQRPTPKGIEHADGERERSPEHERTNRQSSVPWALSYNRTMPYPEPFIAPMRAELTNAGARELRTSDDVDAVLREKGTVMIVVNSGMRLRGRKGAAGHCDCAAACAAARRGGHRVRRRRHRRDRPGLARPSPILLRRRRSACCATVSWSTCWSGVRSKRATRRRSRRCSGPRSTNTVPEPCNAECRMQNSDSDCTSLSRTCCSVCILNSEFCTRVHPPLVCISR